MTNAPFRGALIGCGFFSQFHLHAWSGLEGAEIVAVCDRDEGRARETAKRFNIASVYTDAEAMFAHETLDFVDIATTAPSHRPLVELALRHAGTVVCQKPFAETIEDAEAMVVAANAAEADLIIHENFRWQKPFVTMKELIEQNRLGALQFARFSFRHGFDNYVNQPYLAELERFTIMDVGLHLFDLARHFMGEVSNISCSTQRLNPKVRGEDAFTALLVHSGGLTTICDCSFRSVIDPDPFPRTVAWIEGEDASLGLEADGRLTLHGKNGREIFHAAPDIPSWGEAPWHFVQDSVIRFQSHVTDVLSGRAKPQPSGAHNLKTLELAFSAYEAAASGKTITFS
ncbi:Gfo/Idh/MocA family protein [Thioclava sp. 15-R06ZXC-3]|uniref:Gfo/Idh/MocA family protein n=1 Tax=Thioclava arctica TaxID=3238301 RepID=A0ABV3TSG8_9RHOB